MKTNVITSMKQKIKNIKCRGFQKLPICTFDIKLKIMIAILFYDVEMASNLHKQPSENSMKHNYQPYQTITLMCNKFSW